MPRSNTSRPSDIAVARSPPRKYHFVGTIEDAPEAYRVAQAKSKGVFRVVVEP